MDKHTFKILKWENHKSFKGSLTIFNITHEKG